MSIRSPGGPTLGARARRYRVAALLAIVAVVGAGILYVDRRSDRRTAISSGLAAPRTPPMPVPCIGPPLTSQSQVQPNTTYCGGTVVGRIVLANGDSWTGGDVSGAASGTQQGAVQCGSPCYLYNMYIHDNPGAWSGIEAPSNAAGPMVVSGGRVDNNADLGIAGSSVGQLTISGVEIDHNGAKANCNNEGGGFKGINHGSHFTNNYVHDNNCVGVWYDINAVNNEIDHNHVDNNRDGGIFYEISQNASIHDNEVSGNGLGKCTWLLGAGIGIASSSDIQIYDNTVSDNCNGITGTQQNRPDSVPPDHLLENISIHDNRIAGPGKTGVGADNGNDLTARNIVFADNNHSDGSVLCGLSCPDPSG